MLKTTVNHSRWEYTDVFRYINKTSFDVFGRKFVVDEENKSQLEKFCHWFVRSDKCDELGIDRNKGVLLMGNNGSGKSFLIECMKDNELQPIAMYSLIKIKKEILRNGDFYFYTPRKFMICLDDVGTEGGCLNYYGTSINWFKDYIEMYYFNKEPFFRLIITTHLQPDEIGSLYGNHVRSRLSRMFNVIKFTGSRDFRRQ